MTAHRLQVFSLYRQLLRLHRQLPKDISEVGVVYIRDEFKRHKSIEDIKIIQQFMKEWKVCY